MELSRFLQLILQTSEIWQLLRFNALCTLISQLPVHQEIIQEHYAQLDLVVVTLTPQRNKKMDNLGNDASLFDENTYYNYKKHQWPRSSHSELPDYVVEEYQEIIIPG